MSEKRYWGGLTLRMMPGQTPYTEAELATLEQLVADAADEDPGELEEDRYLQQREKSE